MYTACVVNMAVMCYQEPMWSRYMDELLSHCYVAVVIELRVIV